MSDKYPGGFVTANAPAGFSVAFGGASTSYLSTGTATGLDNISGDFTIEYWQYPSTGISGIAPAIGTANGAFSGTASFFAYETSSNKLHAYLNATQSSSIISYTAPVSLLNVWSHVAWVRSGSTLSLYLNGVSVATVTYTSTISLNTTNSNTYIGKNGWDAYYWLGYLSNIRIVKGTALYTATFTPPTQLFPVINTQLLICQSPTVVDNSTNAYTITANGNAAPSNFTPFAAYQGFNPALGAAAGGVWTLDEAAYYQNNRQWPIYDPYFKNTTLMLHGNGTNGAQNNTFLDSSTNNFTITRNGNTTQGTFSPFSQTGWSYYGTGGACLSVASSSALQFTSGTPFTIEFWLYPNQSQDVNSITPFAKRSGSTVDWQVGLGVGSGAFSLNFYTNGTSSQYPSGLPIPREAWSHCAICWSGTTLRLYVNGVLGTTYSSIVLTQSSVALGIGAIPGGSEPYAGYISNFRVVNGAALYTSSGFTPPTAPLTAVNSTTLLTLQSNKFVDNSANNFAVSVSAGTPSVQAFSPFVPAYITPTTYSNWFDGSGDYLTAPNAAWMNLGTGDFTMECWVQFNSVSSTQMFVSNNYNAGTGGGGWAFLYRQDNTTLKFSCNSNVSYEKTWSPAVGTMYHVAVCRSGTNLRLFVNGVQLGTTSTSTDNISGASSTLVVGTNLGGTPLPINGVISNMRIVTSALYTASFTPPTAPLTAVTNTQLLTCQSSTFIDNSANAATLTANGNVQPVTSPTPFPAKVDTTTLNSAYSTSLIGGSAYFDGSGDYLTAANNAAFNLPADFTIECWWYPMDLSGSSNLFCIGDSRASYNGLLLYWSTGAGKLILYSNGANVVVSSLSTPINTWYHLAAVRSGSTVTFYINGASVGTATNTTTFTGLAGNGFAVGAEYYGTFDTSRKMYLTGSRLVKGTAVYTSNFAPPLAPPTAVTNTQLLLNYTNGAIFDNTAKNVLETVGNAQISTTQSKWGGSSISFDGTGDYLVSNTSTPDLYAFGSGAFTIEFWLYLNTVSANQIVYDGRPSGTQTTQPTIFVSSGVISYYTNNSTVITGSTLSTGQWYHIAVSRSGTSTKMFVNGTQVGSTYTDSTVYTNTVNRPVIGVDSFSVGTNPLNGYVDDMRVTKGVARYITNFTPPTSQLQDQ